MANERLEGAPRFLPLSIRLPIGEHKGIGFPVGVERDGSRGRICVQSYYKSVNDYAARKCAALQQSGKNVDET